MRKSISIGLALGTTLLVAGGGQATSARNSTAATVPVVAAGSGSAVARVALRDEPAANRFERLQQLFRNHNEQEFGLAVYHLEPLADDLVAHAWQRAEELGLRLGTVIDPRVQAIPEQAPYRYISPFEESIVAVDGDRELHIDLESGTEFFVDRAKFHTGAGVPREELLSESEYIGLALDYARASLAQQVAGLDLYPYKVRRYLNAVANLDSDPKVSVYQVAVAFNMRVDGLPVIGPGSKLAIHMTPEGEVISHEITFRRTADPAALLTGEDLIAPSEARAIVEERLRQRGIDLADYVSTRREFGYLRRGRHAEQSILAPYYAFFYEPGPGVEFGRKLVETVSAVAEGPAADLVARDAQREAQRRQSKLDSVAEEDRK